MIFKHRLTLALVLVLSLVLWGNAATFAATTDLIISEYGEGSSNNKYIEIYNGTGASVDLSSYAVWRISNGGSWSEATITLSGTLNDGQTLIVYNPSAVSTIATAGNLQLSSGNISHNGNDAVGLAKNGNLIDAVGQDGPDPGSWAVAGVSNAMADHVLVRKATVCTPNTNWATSSGTNATDSEWIVLSNEDWSNIGSHTSNCGSTTPSIYINELRISASPDAEFFELQGAANTSLDGLTYLVLSGEFNPGQIDEAISLDGHTIPADGFFLAADTAAQSAYGVTADLTTSLSFFGNPVTHLLVSNFTGAKNDDLDTNDDGTLDTIPWDTIIDSVSLIDGDATIDRSYSSVVVGPDGNFAPSGTYRCDDAPTGTFDNNQLTFNPVNGTPGTSNADLCTVVPPTDLVINEIHADPDATNGDANGDGTINTSQDEFVEIVNSGASDIDISGWTLSDAVTVRHTFPANTTVIAGCSIVVFASGTPTGSFGGSVVQTASSNQLGLNNGGDTVKLNNGTTDVVSYTYGSEGGDNQSLTRDPDITGADPLVKHTTAAGANGALYSPGTKGDGSSFGGCPLVVPTVLIHDIQGNGDTSPMSGQTVKIEGIVVGDFQDSDPGNNGDLNGFFVQEEDADADSDPITSEGIFVFDGSSPAVNVANGDKVQVVGTATEFNGLTELISVSSVSVVSSNNTAPTPASVTLPVAAITDLEAFESMSVTFPQTLVINEYFNFDRFGEIVVAPERQFQPTAVYEPGSAAAAALADLNNRSRITIDDGRTASNPDPAIHPNGAEFTLSNRFRGGDELDNVTGVMHYAFDLYRVQPTQGADYTAVNDRTAAPEDDGGSLHVASFNVLNYFTTLNSRGANDTNEFTRQRDKIFAALQAIDADVVGLIEIENNGIALDDLVYGLNSLVGSGTYSAITTGSIGSDEITVAIIYKSATVTPVGSHAVLDSADFLDPNNTGQDKNRPALAQTFMDNNTGGIFTVVVNHLKSKGSECGAGDDDPEQGSCNVTRTLAAQELVDWLATDPTGSGDADFLIIGDLNSYDKEDPIDVLVNGGYTDLEGLYGGEEAYSYVFDGQLGYLDYALANDDLLDEVTGAATWHINADEPDILDYDTTFKQPAQDALYEANAYRASDHDPVVVGLNVCDEIAPTLSVSVSPDTLWPPNHKYVTVTATVTASDNFDQSPTITLIDVTSSEADNGLGDGDKPNDIVIIDTYHVDLRAERAGNGNGRIYTLTYQVTDGCGNSTIATTTVTVPHN